MRQIGLMGGSFNPIHTGHIAMARAALSAGMVEEVWFLPSGQPPHKREGLADKQDRLEMVRLAMIGEAHMQVCTEEMERTGVIYTVDTLGILLARMPDCHFRYLIGADTLRVLHTWRRIDDVIGLCDFLLVMRPGEDTQAILQLVDTWRAKGASIMHLPMQETDISSTEIRRRIAKGENVGDVLPEQVGAYIRSRGLYQSDQ